ncbi:MAG: hypothetical protein JWP27_1456 [Flaviaesturariibacter sp.]|nr:hypothetical protein [Flaviaesturariibacter sp.]
MSTTKRILISLCLSVIITMFFYALFAAGSWEVNPGKWSDSARSMAAFVIGALIALLVGRLWVNAQSDGHV